MVFNIFDPVDQHNIQSQPTPISAKIFPVYLLKFWHSCLFSVFFFSLTETEFIPVHSRNVIELLLSQLHWKFEEPPLLRTTSLIWAEWDLLCFKLTVRKSRASIEKANRFKPCLCRCSFVTVPKECSDRFWSCKKKFNPTMKGNWISRPSVLEKIINYEWWEIQNVKMYHLA